MAYLPIPEAAPGRPGSAEAATAVLGLLRDLEGRKEFRLGAAGAGGAAGLHDWRGFTGDQGGGSSPGGPPGLQLSGAQVFTRNFGSPDTEYSRLLINWQTGAGKSIAAIALSLEFVRQFRARSALGERPRAVHIISFTARETIQEDMLRYPEFGFVSQAEVAELHRARAEADAAGPGSPEARQLAGLLGALRRRITDRVRGGYYRFFGYKEFANRLFSVSRRGAEAGFDLQTLFGRAEGAFGELLSDAVRQGDVTVDEALLDELRGGLLIADEIQNAYNIQEKNNYGIAIQYALDALGPEAPRAVFMSATPMTGSAAEVIDLLNLLVPREALPDRVPLRRSDFFLRAPTPRWAGAEGPAAVVSQLKPGALEKIAHLAAGRVSFLLDSDVGEYPRRVFAGDGVEGVPYLRLTLCPMSPFHERTLDREQAEARAQAGARAQKGAGAPPDEAAGLAANAYALYDMAFPNPDFPPDAALLDADPLRPSYGLYRSGETPARLAQAPSAWRTAAGVSVETGAAAGVVAGTHVIGGAFLGPARLHRYSAKFARVVEATVAAVLAGPGKVMVYHHRVRMSGLLLLQEALRMAGFADETSAPTDGTLCGVCGAPRGGHAAGGSAAAAPALPRGPPRGPPGGHDFVPARFVVAHSDIDRAEMLRSIARYNSPSNAFGHEIRVLLGSRVIREGFNFKGVRHLHVASLPTDFPTLIQVIGRAVRKGSHLGLPESQREVLVRIFVTSRADGRPSPELRRYSNKGQEYLAIQEVERALRVYAVDGFANEGRIRAALGAEPGGAGAPSLDGLPFRPAGGPGGPAPGPPSEATFAAYGHGEREVEMLSGACRALFRARPVWTYEDLWGAVRGGAVLGASHDPARFDEGNFAAALVGLARPVAAGGAPATCIVRVGRYYLLALAGAGGPVLDVESYLRDFAPRLPGHVSELRGGAPPPRVAVRVADYVSGARAGQNFSVRLRAFEAAYLAEGGAPGKAPLELALVDFGAAFHYELLRRLVVAGWARAGPVTADDGRVADLYRRFRVALTAADLAAAAGAGGAARASRKAARPGALVGYLTPEGARLYDGDRPEGPLWYSAPLADFGIGRRHRENNIVVGFVTSVGSAGAGRAGQADEGAAASGAEARFKLRPPIQDLHRPSGGVRALARGAVCETRPREDLLGYHRSLRAAVAAAAGKGPARDGLAPGGAPGLALRLADHPPLPKHPPTLKICEDLRLYLLALEELSRAGAKGMADGVRYVYLTNDVPPSVAAIMGKSSAAGN